MIKKTFQTEKGNIVYWTNEYVTDRENLVFLPGLTADHRLFKHQVEFFKDRYNVLVWDAPGHNESRPFELSFSLKDKAVWLHEILMAEDMGMPILIGQSMGGYVSQMYLEIYPGEVKGFVAIDSAPLKKKYMSAPEIWFMKHTETMYRSFPWKSLQKAGSKGCSTTEYGRRLMVEMMNTYEKTYYCKLVSHGYRILGEAIDADLPYEICCPAILVCGEEDKAAATKRYNKKWTVEEGLTMHWVKDAGHNSNTDCPNKVNKILADFVAGIID